MRIKASHAAKERLDLASMSSSPAAGARLEILTCGETAVRLKTERRTDVRMWTSAEGVSEASTQIPDAASPTRRPARGGRRAEAPPSRGRAYPDAATDRAALLRMLPDGGPRGGQGQPDGRE